MDTKNCIFQPKKKIYSYGKFFNAKGDYSAHLTSCEAKSISVLSITLKFSQIIIKKIHAL